MTKVFLSYVSENYPAAKKICDILQDNGIDVWIDRNQLKAGQVWLHEIRNAIQSGSYFIPIFSGEWIARTKSVANEELLIAIEELRKRPYAQQWLIPVKLNGCAVPDVPIGVGRTINDIHYIDFSTMDTGTAFRALLAAVGVDKPKLSKVNLGASGWPAHIRIVRRDKWVDQVPLDYFIGSSTDPLRTEKSVIDLERPAGYTKFICRTRTRFIPPFQSRGGNMQGTYFCGMSDEIGETLLSGHSYELFVSADSMFAKHVFIPPVELVKLIYAKFTGDGVDLDNSKTWPKIQMKLIRL